MEQEKYKGRTLLCLFHFPHLYQMLLIAAAEVPTSGDYKLNIESLLHQHLHKILMTQPPTPPNEHKSHNWTQSLNYMVMHQSNPTAPILYVLIVIQWSIQSLCLWNLNSTSNSPVAPHRLSCQFSANQQEAETSANVNKH